MEVWERSGQSFSLGKQRKSREIKNSRCGTLPSEYTYTSSFILLYKRRESRRLVRTLALPVSPHPFVIARLDRAIQQQAFPTNSSLGSSGQAG
jgi:hypothetical protein